MTNLARVRESDDQPGDPRDPALPLLNNGFLLAMPEFFDVCDEHDQVLRQAPREEVHANRWLHRAVHVFVFNARGELLLQMRSAHKDEYPLTYTSSASGHLHAGESYDEAAPRELEEELGLVSPLERLHKFPAEAATSWEHTVLYYTRSDGPMRVDPWEIQAVAFHPLDEISAMIVADHGKFSPCFTTLFSWYVRERPSPSGRS